MNARLTAAGITLAGAVFAMVVGPDGPLGGFWRPEESEQTPNGAQTAGLVGAGLVEALGFGLAVAILVLGRPLFARITSSPARATVAWLGSAWLLGSWWPHTALHRHFGADVDALVFLEVIFHAGSIVVAGALLWAVLPTLMSHYATTEKTDTHSGITA
jgi:hypothetical protein